MAVPTRHGLDGKSWLQGKWLNRLRRPWLRRRRPPVRYTLFGGCCCSIEMIPLLTDRYRPDEYDIRPARSVDEADTLVVAGPVTEKNAPLIREVYDLMPQPRWVVAFSACSCGGGPYHQGATVLDGVDTLIPVDVYVPGNPPRPEALIHALLAVQQLKAQGRQIDAIDRNPYQ
ncbi:MAG TPA: NADH-quinone oxidoreductase subunit NuoB [Bacillota bacterium]